MTYTTGGGSTSWGPSHGHRDASPTILRNGWLARLLLSFSKINGGLSGGTTRRFRNNRWEDIWKPSNIGMFCLDDTASSVHQAVVKSYSKEEGQQLAPSGSQSNTIVMDVNLTGIMEVEGVDTVEILEAAQQNLTAEDFAKVLTEVFHRLHGKPSPNPLLKFFNKVD